MANLSEDKGTSLRVDNALNYEIMRTMQTLDAGAELASLCYSKCVRAELKAFAILIPFENIRHSPKLFIGIVIVARSWSLASF